MPHPLLYDCAHVSPVCLISLAMAPKRRTVKAQPFGTSNSMHQPPDQRTVGLHWPVSMWNYYSRQSEEPPRDTVRRRRSLPPTAPSRMQREAPPRLSQMPTQPMEWTPRSTYGRRSHPDYVTPIIPTRGTAETQPGDDAACATDNWTKPSNWGVIPSTSSVGPVLNKK